MAGRKNKDSQSGAVKSRRTVRDTVIDTVIWFSGSSQLFVSTRFTIFLSIPSVRTIWCNREKLCLCPRAFI